MLFKTMEEAERSAERNEGYDGIPRKVVATENGWKVEEDR